MRSYKLNQSTIWSSLPWDKIQMRIFMLQQQIYKSSKFCNIFLMHKWQNLLLNCNEIKLMATHIISNYTLEYYSIYNSTKYKVNDKLKFFLFKNIYRDYNCDLVIKNLLELIKQYIVYLCIQSEWEAKFEPVFQQEFSQQSSYLYQKKIVHSFKFFNEYTKNKNLDLIATNFHHEIILKYSNQSYLINKFQSLPYINYCLMSWLDNDFASNLLKDLNYKVLLTGIEWFNIKNIELDMVNQIYDFTIENSIYHSMYNMCFIKFQQISICALSFIVFALKLHRKSKNFGNRIIYTAIHHDKLSNKKTSYLFYGNYYLYQVLRRSIKLLIYKRNLLNKWRIKKQLKLSQVIYLFIHQCTKFYTFFCLFLNTEIIRNVKQIVNKYLVLWMKKKYTKYSNFNFTVNHLLNRQFLLIKRQASKDLCITSLFM